MYKQVESISTAMSNLHGYGSADDMFARHFAGAVYRIVKTNGVTDMSMLNDVTTELDSDIDIKMVMANIGHLLKDFKAFESPNHPHLQLLVSLLSRAAKSVVLSVRLPMIVPIIATLAQPDVNALVRVKYVLSAISSPLPSPSPSSLCRILSVFHQVLAAIHSDEERKLYREWTPSIIQFLLPNVSWKIGIAPRHHLTIIASVS